MKALALAILALTAAPAFADTLECTLSSGKKSDTVSLDLTKLENPYDAKLGEKGVYDLSFDLAADCKPESCSASITIYSQKIEDEVGSTGFEFTRGAAWGEVHREPLTGAPDKKKYELSCAYVK